MMKKAPVLLPLIALMSLALVYACDSANPVAPPGTVITLSVSPTTIGLNDTATITVTGFRPDGNPLNPGTQVTLSTSLGVITPTTVTIGSTGIGTATLSGDGRTGTATITATTPGSDSMATVDVQIGQTAESKPTLTITVTPSTLGLNETATVSVLARQADGSPFGGGGQVFLETTLGRLDSELLVTDSDGRAETTFNSGGQAGSAEITGFIGASDEAMATVTIENQRPALVISANPNSIPVNATSEITILARDNNGSPLGAGERIQLIATLGSIADEVFTDSEGRAETLFRAGADPGTGQVQALLGTSEVASVNIEIRDAVAEFIFTTTTPTIDRPTGDETQTVRLIGTVRNARGQAINNILVTFNSPEVGGTFQTPSGTPSDGTVATSGNGVAQVDLVVNSAGVGTRTSFRVEATVVSEGQTFTRTLTINVRP